MSDKRTTLEKKLWDTIGAPLYYCADCLRSVHVKPVDGGEPIINRPCDSNCGGQIIAPRRAIATGKGGANLGIINKVRLTYWQIAAKLTGRCV